MSVHILEIDDVLKLRSEAVLRSLGAWIGNMLEGSNPACLICDEPMTIRNSPARFVVMEADASDAQVWAICPTCDCRPDFHRRVSRSLGVAVG